MAVVKNFLTFFLLAAVIIVSGCTKNKPKPPKPDFTYHPGGIQIRYIASKELNSYDNKPHTLLMVVYQLSDVNAFNNLAAGEQGVKKLLSAKIFDPSAVAVDKIIVSPGEEKTIKLARAEKARWVGIAAGYYDLTPSSVTRLFKIPVLIEEEGLISKEKTATLGRLFINIRLAKHEIYRVGGE